MFPQEQKRLSAEKVYLKNWIAHLIMKVFQIFKNLKSNKMKQLNFTILVAITLLFATHTMAQLPGNVPTSGLVGYWPLNGNTNDYSGNNNNGVNNGATLTADPQGNANQAYYFNGSSYISVANNAIFNFGSTDYTVSAWAMRSGTNRLQRIVCKALKGPTYKGWGIRFENSNISFASGGGNNGTWYSNGSAALNSITNNQWYHMVGVFSPSTNTVKLYVNGVLVTSNTSAVSPFNSDNSNDLMFGVYQPGGAPSGPEFLTGKIDEIGLWNRALTQQEITSLYIGCSFSTSITSGGSTTFCQGNSVTLSSINQGSPYTFQWLLNGNNIGGATAFSYTATASGNYSVVVDSLGCSDTSNVITVTVNSLPIVSINAIPAFINYFASPLTLTGNPSGGTFSGSGITGNSFNPTTAGLGSHSILYNYTDGNSCSNSATVSTIIIDAVLTGIAPPNNVNTVKIYPNPASTHITIDNGNYVSMAGYTIRIDNNLSQTVFTQPINQASFYVDLSSWTVNGLYFVYIIDNLGNTIEIKKIALQ